MVWATWHMPIIFGGPYHGAAPGWYSAICYFVLVIAAALLGGAGSPVGAVLSALVLGIATEIVAAAGGTYYSQAAGLAILAIVLVARSSAHIWTGPERNEVTV